MRVFLFWVFWLAIFPNYLIIQVVAIYECVTHDWIVDLDKQKEVKG